MLKKASFEKNLVNFEIIIKIFRWKKLIMKEKKHVHGIHFQIRSRLIQKINALNVIHDQKSSFFWTLSKKIVH